MTEDKQIKTHSVPSKTPTVHEESIEGYERGAVCEICGKTFKTHTELDRHKENVHGNPEKTHTHPHAIE